MQDLKLVAQPQFIVVDEVGVLPQLYKAMEVVFMGDSLAEDAR